MCWFANNKKSQRMFLILTLQRNIACAYIKHSACVVVNGALINVQKAAEHYTSVIKSRLYAHDYKNKKGLYPYIYIHILIYKQIVE